MAVNFQAPNSHAERVAARVTAWEGSPTNAGRQRLRGGKRGQPSRLASDSLDARIALRSLERAIEHLEQAGNASTSAFARDELHRVAVAQCALAWKAIEKVCDRDAAHRRARAKP